MQVFVPACPSCCVAFCYIILFRLAWRIHLAVLPSIARRAFFLTPFISTSFTLATMDIVLEVIDAFVFDRFYASFWPALPGPGAINSIQNMPNATTWSFRNAATAPLNNFQFKPASQYISVAPSKWAYLTSWPRDDPYRQLLSLYLITWYVCFYRLHE